MTSEPVQMVLASVGKSDDEAESPTSACLLDTGATDPLWPALNVSSHDPISDAEITDDQCSPAQPPKRCSSCEPARRLRLPSRKFDPCARMHSDCQGRYMTLSMHLMKDPLGAFRFCGVLVISRLESTLGDIDALHNGAGTCDGNSGNHARSGGCVPACKPAEDAIINPSPRLCRIAGDIPGYPSSHTPANITELRAHTTGALRHNDAKSAALDAVQFTATQQGPISHHGFPDSRTVNDPTPCTSPVLPLARSLPSSCSGPPPSSVDGPLTPEFEGWASCDVRGEAQLSSSRCDTPRTAHRRQRSTADSLCDEVTRLSGSRPCFLTPHDTALSSSGIAEAPEDVVFNCSPALLHSNAVSRPTSAQSMVDSSNSRLEPSSARHQPHHSAACSQSAEAQDAQSVSFQSQPASMHMSDDARSPPRIGTPVTSSYEVLPAMPAGPDEGDTGAAEDTEVDSAAHVVGSVSTTPPAPQPSAGVRAREQHPDVPLRGVAGRAPPQLAQLDQHLLDRVLLKVTAGGSAGALNAAAVSCRRLRNAVRRIAGSAGPPTLDCAPPVDSATAALDIRALHSFPSLHTLRLPKLDRGVPTLPVDLFRLRHLTLLTHLDVACAAAVPSFQPLRLLPNLRKLSVSGVTLAPPPDIPDIQGCEVILYANRALAAATRGNVLTNLPPLSGLRVASKAPSALLQQIGNARCAAGLTYLRLGCCSMPQLAPLATLTRLARLHLHMLRGQVGPLAPLSQLTYLHLHGSVEDLPQSLGFFRRLQKLSLIKCRRLRPDEVRAIGTLSELTSLELPHSKAMHALRDVRPLSRLMSLQHLSLAMPDSGIAPLIGLTSLTFLRLKCRVPSTEARPPATNAPLAAGLFTPPFILCNLATAGHSASGLVSGRCTAVNAAAASVAESTVTVAVALACAAAAPLAVYAARRVWRSVVPAPAEVPEGPVAGRLSELAQMQQLEWLEVKSSTLPTAAEWTAALAPLTRLRRLDVRNTAFRDVTALRNMAHLSVLLVSGCTGLPRNDRVLREQAGLGAGAEVRR